MSAADASSQKSLPWGGIVGLALMALTVLAGTLLDSERVGAATGVDLAQLPEQIGEWKSSQSLKMDPSSRDTLQLNSYVKRFYSKPDGSRVYLYAGYWDKQSGEHQAAKHSPVTCLPSNGWSISSPKKVELAKPSFKVNRLTGAFGKGNNLFYYWFYTANETYLDEWKALIKISVGNLFHGRSDGGIVELSIPYGDAYSEEKADAILEEFVSVLLPALSEVTKTAQATETASVAQTTAEKS